MNDEIVLSDEEKELLCLILIFFGYRILLKGLRSNIKSDVYEIKKTGLCF